MFQLRPATENDQPGIVKLIDEVLREYNDRICLADAEADLQDLRTNFADKGGVFWVLSETKTAKPPVIIGSHAGLPDPDQEMVCNFKRLYLAKPFRGSEWGERLMQVAVDWAIEKKFRRVEFWSDTRFQRAHNFFQKFGFQKTGQIRSMNDALQPYQEFFFYLDLAD